jgi:predicted permease
MLTGTQLSAFGGSFYTTGRLRGRIEKTAGEAELRGLTRQLVHSDTARYGGMTVRLDHIRGVNAEERAGFAVGSAFLMSMVGLVLLIGCANVANLLLGRAATRRTEFGVRLAIGANRMRLVRQLLTESLMIAAIGGVAGFLVAQAITRMLPSLLPPEAGLDSAFLRPDVRVVLFTSALCLLTTILFGLVPALHAASTDVVAMLKGSESRIRRGRRRGALVVGQAALCVVLLAVASLFLRSLANSRTVDPGFRAEGIIDVNIDLGLLGGRADAPTIFARILRETSAMPSVKSATLAAVVPLSGSNMESRAVPEGAVAGRDRRAGSMVYFNVVAPAFFSTLQTAILRGREFAETDGATSTPVAVVNETAARRLWPNGDALGRRFRWGDDRLYQVVGVARDANYVMPGEAPKATVYLPFAQAEHRSEMTLQLRTSADLTTTRQAVWALVHDAVPQLPPPPVVRMADDMAITLLPVRLGAALLGTFGALALVLAAAGIYGVASYSVSRRTREIGIRAALGATRTRIVRMVLWENGRRVAAGTAIGLGVAILIGVGLSSILYGVRPVDPLALGGVAVAIAIVAAAASIGPARRAANADPVRSIRSE